jgi:hypothetical protein
MNKYCGGNKVLCVGQALEPDAARLSRWNA